MQESPESRKNTGLYTPVSSIFEKRLVSKLTTLALTFLFTIGLILYILIFLHLLQLDTAIVIFSISVILSIILVILLLSFNNQQKLQSQLLETQLNMLNSQAEIRETMNDTAWQANFSDTNGGYIIYDLPNEHRSFFHDLLKGFEEYAKLKGYSISFSIDNSIDNKIAFKFTILSSSTGVNVGQETVRVDIAEYIIKVKKGLDINDIPISINQVEHERILSALKERLQFIQSCYKREQKEKKYMEKLLDKVMNSRFGIQQQPNLYINLSGTQIPQQIQGPYVKGDNNKIGDENYDYITISNSFNKRNHQCDKIVEIIDAIKKEDIPFAVKNEIERELELLKKELLSKDKPDKVTIGGILKNMKKHCENFIFMHETTQAINWLCNSLGMML